MRLFAAIDLPPATRLHLSSLAGSGIPGARWEPPANYHLTLRFVGEVDRRRAEDVDLALESVRAKPFELSLAGVGTFERSGRLAALWAGVERGEALERLQGKIEAALRRAGFEPERRRYQPHVTLARLDHAPPERVGAFVQRHNLFRADPFRVEAFALFSSHPGRDHAEYVAEAEYPLAG